MAQRMKTHTDYDFAHVEELQRVVGGAVTQSATRRSRITSLAMGAVMLVIAVLLAVRGSHWGLIGAAGAVALFFAARAVFYYPFVAFGVMQGMDKSITGSDYLLEKSWMLVTNPKGSSQYPYEKCHRLLETEKNLYFIMKSGQGLILDKDNLKGGTPEELRAWMEKKCGKKAEWLGNVRRGIV